MWGMVGYQEMKGAMKSKYPWVFGKTKIIKSYECKSISITKVSIILWGLIQIIFIKKIVLCVFFFQKDFFVLCTIKNHKNKKIVYSFHA